MKMRQHIVMTNTETLPLDVEQIYSLSLNNSNNWKGGNLWFVGNSAHRFEAILVVVPNI